MKLAAVKTPLQEHQQRVVDRIKTQPGLVVAHGMGSGKTLSSIAAAEQLAVPTAVVTPAALQSNFRKEISKHVEQPEAEYRHGSLQQAARTGRVPEGELLIVDEAHRLRDPSSKSQRAVAQSGASKRLLLTGTPLYNRPYDLASLVNVAAGEKVFPGNQTEFERRYIGQKITKPGLLGRLRGIKPGSTPVLNNAEELGGHLQKWVDYHENDTTDFPERRDIPVQATMSPRQKEVYDTIMEKAPSWVQYKVRKGLPPSKAESKQLNAFLTASRAASVSPAGYATDLSPDQAAELSPKLTAAFERLNQAIEKNPNHRAVVYSNFLESGITPYEAMLKSKGVSYGKFTGETSKKDRDRIVQDYNSGKLRALLLSSAGGEGLDLKGTRQIQVLDPHWNKEKLEQVIARGIRYKSHADLPEDQRTVDVEQYLSSMPEPGRLRRLLGGKRQGSVDEYLQMLSKQKDDLNQQVRSLMKQEKTSLLEVLEKTARVEKAIFQGFVDRVLEDHEKTAPDERDGKQKK